MTAKSTNVETWLLAALTGAFSFTHIHDFAVMHGQGGLKAWGYPGVIDAVTVHALRLILNPGHQRPVRVLAWCEFALFFAFSLAANLLLAPAHDYKALILYVAPPVGFLFTTLSGHMVAHQRNAPAPAPAEADQSEPPPAPAPAPAKARTARRPAPAKRTSGQGTRTDVARDLAADFLHAYRGPRIGRGDAFTAHVNSALAAKGLPKLHPSRCRDVLIEYEKVPAKA